MCDINHILFGAQNLRDVEIRDRKVIEIGSRNINGSLRPFVESRKPATYIGVDLVGGEGVDMLLDAENLMDTFEPESFDIVISTSVLEHVKDWRKVISNIKNTCNPGGIILLTTVSIGFHYHAYPHDFWRYEPDDMKYIFSDCEIEALETGPEMGVFIKVIKPLNFIEEDLSGFKLFSIVTGRRVGEIAEKDLRAWHFRKTVAKSRVRNVIKSVGMKLLRLF